ncbi:hypothetical protein [Mycobacterium sp. MUNTM1]
MEIEALGRLRPELSDLGSSLKHAAQSPYKGATPDPAGDSPSLVAARAVSSEAIPAVQSAIADRFTEVGDLVEMARTRFTRADQDLITAINAGGSLLPPDSK